MSRVKCVDFLQTWKWRKVYHVLVTPSYTWTIRECCLSLFSCSPAHVELLSVRCLYLQMLTWVHMLLKPKVKATVNVLTPLPISVIKVAKKCLMTRFKPEFFLLDGVINEQLPISTTFLPYIVSLICWSNQPLTLWALQSLIINTTASSWSCTLIMFLLWQFAFKNSCHPEGGPVSRRSFLHFLHLLRTELWLSPNFRLSFKRSGVPSWHMQLR